MAPATGMELAGPLGLWGGPHGALGLWGLCLLWNGTCVAFALLLIMYNLKLEAWSRCPPNCGLYGLLLLTLAL